jgi:hypothetical protein
VPPDERLKGLDVEGVDLSGGWRGGEGERGGRARDIEGAVNEK